MSEKRAYTPAEFAALFGREKTWTYRMLYAGKIKRLDGSYGKTMIPASEAARIEADVEPHQAAKDDAASQEAGGLPPAKGSARWSAWVKSRASASSKKKGVTKKASNTAPLRRGKLGGS